MMKKNIKSILCIFLLVTTSLYSSEELRGISIFSPRAQNDNAERDIAGWHPYIHRYDATKNYAAMSFTASYNQSLRPRNMSLALFNDDTLTITGSQVDGRAETSELLADYFGLSPTFSSVVYFKPLIQNLIFDTALYIGFDSWVHGLYLQFRAPAVWTKWNIGLKETVLESGSETSFPAGYMGPTAVAAPYTSFTQAMNGMSTFGDVQPLQFGKLDGAQKKGGLAAFEIVFGYDFINREMAHFGINARVSAPTGSRTKGIFFFEPRVGNGKLWQAGIGFTGHTRVWEKDGDQELGFYVDVNFTHQCKGHEIRSFDFKKTGTQILETGFFSRYILAKQFNQNDVFDNTIVPSINFTTLPCTVHVDIQMDAVLMFGYTYRDFTFDIGYGGWIRSREKISLRQCITPHLYGLKGVQFADNPLTQLPTNTTESTATIFETQIIVPDANSPIFISTDDLNLRSAASPLLLTNKFFVHLEHSFLYWKGHTAVPFLGMGAEIEFEGINTRNALQPDNTTMGQASVWFKGGFLY